MRMNLAKKESFDGRGLAAVYGSRSRKGGRMRLKSVAYDDLGHYFAVIEVDGHEIFQRVSFVEYLQLEVVISMKQEILQLVAELSRKQTSA